MQQIQTPRKNSISSTGARMIDDHRWSAITV